MSRGQHIALMSVQKRYAEPTSYVECWLNSKCTFSPVRTDVSVISVMDRCVKYYSGESSARL